LGRVRVVGSAPFHEDCRIGLDAGDTSDSPQLSDPGGGGGSDLLVRSHVIPIGVCHSCGLRRRSLQINHEELRPFLGYRKEYYSINGQIQVRKMSSILFVAIDLNMTHIAQVMACVPRRVEI
jgi:hypothetical protein